jgi:ABC-type glycerol-3-phosphate transport system substrate-binding protein
VWELCVFSASLRSLSVVLLIALVTVGQGCTRGPDASAVAASQRTDIRIWGVVDDLDAYDAILSDYRKIRPYANIEYRRFRLEEYEEALVNALAEDRGPDIFLDPQHVGHEVHAEDPAYAGPRKVAQQTIQGTLKKEVVYQLTTEPTVSLRKYKTDYPDVVAQDFIRRVNVSTVQDKTDIQERVMAIPMSVDTMAMYVNKDLLNAAGIATIPETWEDFQTAIKKAGEAGCAREYSSGGCGDRNRRERGAISGSSGGAHDAKRSRDVCTGRFSDV